MGLGYYQALRQRPLPFFSFDCTKTSQFSFVTIGADQRITSYTCPYSGLVFTQPTDTAKPFFRNGVASFDGGQFLELDNKSAFRFLCESKMSLHARFLPRGLDPLAAFAVFGNNGGSGSNTGLYFLYEDRNSIGNNSLNFSISGVWNGYLGADLIAAHANRFTPNAWNTTSVDFDGSRYRTSVNTWANADGTLFAPTGTRTGDATFPMRIGAIGGTTSFYFQGEIDYLAFYKARFRNPLEEIQRINTNR